MDPLWGFRYDRSMTSRRACVHPVAIAALVMCTGVASASCGLGAIGAPNVVDQASEPQCKQAKDPLHPLIVEWSAANKVALDSASRRGIVIVSLDGCNLRVVTGCAASGAYDTQSSKPDRHSLELKDRNDLFAFLPLAAPRLGASFASGKTFVLDYVTVGERAVSKNDVDVSGDCAGATHFVKRIRFGAYSLAAGADAKAEAAAEIGPLTAGGTHQESDRREKASGDPSKCEGAPDDPSCQAPVQLELVALSGPPRPGSEAMMMRDR